MAFSRQSPERQWGQFSYHEPPGLSQGPPENCPKPHSTNRKWMICWGLRLPPSSLRKYCAGRAAKLRHSERFCNAASRGEHGFARSPGPQAAPCVTRIGKRTKKLGGETVVAGISSRRAGATLVNYRLRGHPVEFDTASKGQDNVFCGYSRTFYSKAPTNGFGMNTKAPPQGRPLHCLNRSN